MLTIGTVGADERVLGSQNFIAAMDYPPNKRHRGPNQDVAFNDPFGDDDDFTQDDLNEIDIIASQAAMGDVGSSKQTLGTIGSGPEELSKPLSGSRKTPDWMNQNRDNKPVGHSSYTETPGVSYKGGFGNGLQSKASKDYNQLEAEQAELKKRLKEVEEEILMKNGEIRVLRDSLRTAQQEKEQQRRVQLLLEREKAHVQSEKEKELAKKVQSLQSELHFKEAEMNEMKTKLQNSERGHKAVASPVPKNSPRMHCSAAPVHLGSGSSSTSPGGSAFITKETFAAQLPSRSTPVEGSGKKRLRDEGRNSRHSDSKAASHAETFEHTGLHHHQHHHPGSVLLSLLLQHPLDPSTLGLCHLLCISPEALPTLLQNNYLTQGHSTGSSSSSTEPKVVQKEKTHSRFSQLQSLAMSGLNMMALPEQASHINGSNRSCPGAVHLLPLLEYHISLFCQTLESLEGSINSPLRGSSVSGSSSEASMTFSVEDSLGCQEQFAVAAVRALYHIISQSSEAVDTLLSYQPQESGGGDLYPRGANKLHPTLIPSETQPKQTGRVLGSSDRARDGAQGERRQIQHPLLRGLLQLADPTFTGKAVQREELVTTSLSTLNMVAERVEQMHLSRLECVLSSQAMTRCLSLDSSYQNMSLSLTLLAALVSNDELATKLCSHSDLCLFVKIFQYITSRPDKLVTDGHWSVLEVEVVRFLTKLFTQTSSTWVTFVNSNCLCHSEVVQTVVVVLHRQWLDIRGRETAHESHVAQAPAWWSAPGVQLLRESLLLLHWLLLHHSSFSEHCRPVLHMYDQVIPAVRDTLRKIPDLTESEELALEDICRPEAEDTEDMDPDS